MSCNCNNTLSPSGEPLPSISDVQGLSAAPTPCCEDSSCASTVSEGSTLASSWLDSACHATGLTILARVGDKLARFAGSGFLQLVDGKFNVVQSISIRVTTLWHRWWKPTAASRPILGEPLAYPYLAIASEAGDVHGIKGPDEEDAVPHWNSTTKEFTNKPISEIPQCVKGAVTRGSGIELTGYTPIPSDGLATAVRCPKALSGKGLVILTEQATVASGTVSAATTKAFPTPVADEVFTLKYSTALGLHWSEDA